MVNNRDNTYREGTRPATFVLFAGRSFLLIEDRFPLLKQDYQQPAVRMIPVSGGVLGILNRFSGNSR